MKLDFSKKQITALIIIFPLISLLLYGGMSYLFFSYAQKQNSVIELQNYEKSLIDIEKEKIIAKIIILKQLIYYYDHVNKRRVIDNTKEIIDALKYFAFNSHSEDEYLLLFDKNANIIFSSDDKIYIDFNSTKKSEHFYTDQKYIYYVTHIQKYDWYLIVAKNLKSVQKDIENKKFEKQIKHQKDIKTNFYILGFTWLLSILLSIYLSVIIRQRLTHYENQINQNKEKLIFQSKQALIGELFSMIAHQWRQPINKIASIVALMRFDLENNKVDAKEIDKSCEEIENSIEFMSETIDDFRTFYKPTTETKLVNLKTLIERSVTFLKNSIVKNDIRVVKELENIKIRLYRNEFLQVMLNLVKNAIDAIGTQGVIIIKLYKSGANKIIISVENSGESISEKIMPKIFDPYFTTKEDSMGLGLYMTKMIVEKHMNGHIRVERLKDGTRFVIELKNYTEL